MTDKKCLWCGADTSFLAFCEGVCIECGDRMLVADKTLLIHSLAKATREVLKLEQAAKEQARSEETWKLLYDNLLKQHDAWAGTARDAMEALKADEDKRASDDPYGRDPELEFDPFNDGWVKGLQLAADVAESEKHDALASKIRWIVESCPGQVLCTTERDEVIEAFSRISKLVPPDSEVDQIASATWSHIAYLKSREES